MKPRNPPLAVDCVVLDPAGRLLLIRRKNPPFQGQYALPGGFVDYGETTEHAAARELAEETGLVATGVSLVGVYSDPKRDPRGHVVSVAYRVETAGYEPTAGDDAAAAEFVAGWGDLDLAFDHRSIVADAMRPCRPAAAKPASGRRPKRQPGRST
jgi:8-oxo-dGTP diphosphatase